MVFITFITVLTLFIFILGISLDRDVCSDNENDNLPEIVELYGNNSRKITCDLYIDDRSVCIDAMGNLQGAAL